ncbi:MAG: hypothetical protein ABIT76_07705 [Chthoniobacterales bacterium]
MELLVATLCDTASENQGKLNVIGAFDAIIAQSFPANFSFMLALRFSFTAKDHGSHAFYIQLVDDSGEPDKSAPNESKMDVNMPPGTAGFSTQNMITPLQGTIAKAGTYHFDVHFEKKILAHIPLRVIAQSDIAAPAAAPAA